MAWLALVAALLLVVVPTVSRVIVSVAPRAMPVLMEMCTITGLKLLDVSSLINDGEPAQPMVLMDDACGYCMLTTPPPVILALLCALLLAPPLAPAARRICLPFLRTARNTRGLGSQAPPITL